MVDLVIRRRARRWFAPFLLALACGYFLAHAFVGAGGVATLIETRADIAALETRLADMRSRRAALEATAERLDPNDPDLDLLSEMIRRHYGYVRAGEIIIRLERGHG